MIASIDWSSVGLAGLVLLGVGLFLVAILNIAFAKLFVKPDETVEAILNALPGANCGGCGLAGCSAYAEAVAKDPALMGKCGPGGDSVAHAIAAILGIEAVASAPLRAVVHCGAKNADRINTTRYRGIQSCREAQVVAGAIGCPYGCFGLGDCQAACQFDAIHVVDGLATVDYNKCIGCGACAAACPRQIIEMIPMKEDPLLVIACSSLDSAKDVRSYCQVGCVGCGICAKLTPTMFQMKQNLAVIDYAKYAPREEYEKSAQKCPRKIIQFRGKQVKITEPEPANADTQA